METKSLYKSRASWDKESIVVFSEHPELLACDPANSIWVYGVYEYKYGVQDTKATRQLAQLVDEMMLSAFRLYEQAAKTFWELSPSEREAMVLREVIKHDGAVHSSTLTRSNSLSKRLSIGSTRRLSRVSLHSEYSVSDATHEQKKVEHNNRTSTSSPSSLSKKWSRADHAVDNITYIRSESQYNSVLFELLEHWPVNNLEAKRASNNISNNNKGKINCKVKVCVDMIASRKSLQEMPTKSAPYMVGQSVYRYLFAKYAHHVMHATVGISDAKVKLTCRDVLFPFKRVISSSELKKDHIANVRAPGSAKADKYKASNKVRSDVFGATTSKTATSFIYRENVRQADAFTSERTSRPKTADAFTVNDHCESFQHQTKGNDVNSLIYIRQPPFAAHDAIDQRRLLVCFCPLLLSS